MVPLPGFVVEQNNERKVGFGVCVWGGVFHLPGPPSFPSPLWLPKSHTLFGPLLVATLFILSWWPAESLPRD